MARRYYRDERGRFISEANAVARVERAAERVASWLEQEARARSAKEAARVVRNAERADAALDFYLRQLPRPVRDAVLGLPPDAVADVVPAVSPEVPADDAFEDEYYEYIDDGDEWEIEFSVDYEPAR